MRIAYLEQPAAPEVAIELWEAFNAWRLRSRPALGRIDIAAIGWWIVDQANGQPVALRTGVPIRSDYQAPAPAKTTFFPGGTYVYAYADDADEIDAALAAVISYIEEHDLNPIEGPIELYKFHYNLDQHPADCGFLIEADEADARVSGPLVIGR